MSSYLVFGAGTSGLSACCLLQQLNHQLYLVDQKPLGPGTLPPDLDAQLALAHRLTEEQVLKNFPPVETLVLSPGIARNHPLVLSAINQGIEVISEIELGYRHLPNKNIPIVAITGANGKTTTTTLLSHILQTSGLRVFTGGNIGNPLCELARAGHTLVPEVIVLELSSFQLESMVSFKPHIAMILNLVMNHGERYKNLEEYARAKFHITDNLEANDFFIYPQEVHLFQSMAKNLNCHTQAVINQEVLAMVKAKPWAKFFDLPGEHNWLNLAWAYLAIDRLGYKWDEQTWMKAVASFHGVEHRLERLAVGERIPFKIYNDAKSTNFTATWTAISAFAGHIPLGLVFGGKARGNDLSQEHEELLLDRCQNIYLIGETALSYFERLSRNSKRRDQVVMVGSLQQLGLKLREFSQSSPFEVLIFSPGHPSFDQFTSYIHRGESFKKIIGEL